MKRYNNRIHALKLEIEDILMRIELAENHNKHNYADRLKKIVEIKQEKLNKWIKMGL